MTLIDNLEAMLGKGQDNALLRYGLGGEYLKHQQFDKAALHLRKAVELDPHYSAAWKLLGQALTSSGQLEQAAEVYARGIEVAERKGDIQAAKEMRVFAKRVSKSL
jgi:Tfp pilus assembly protein PilF